MKISLIAVLLGLFTSTGLSIGYAATPKSTVESSVPSTAQKDRSTDVKLVAKKRTAAKPATKPLAWEIFATARSLDSKAPADNAKVAPVSVSWPQDGSDLKADTSAVFGNLENGLRYVIYPTKAEPGRASLRLFVNTGSFMERENERGIAHFLEHMAFNGTRRFPAGQMIEYFQRLGLTFGAHTNAMTTSTFTSYNLDLPRAGQEMTAGIKFFRDVLDGMLLDEVEIEKERGVVLRELSSSNSAGQRIYEAAQNFVLPDTLVATKLPIGTAECISAMPRSRFVEFYQKWYTTDRAAVIVVGDVKVDQVRKLIEQEFADARAPRTKQKDPAIGKIPSGQGVTAKWLTEKDAAGTSVELSVFRPVIRKADSVARRREGMIKGLANLMLQGRFAKLASSSGSVIQNAGSSGEKMFDFIDKRGYIAQCDPAQCVAVVELLEHEIRRAGQYGFTKTELDEAKSMALANAERMVGGAETLSPAQLAGSIVNSFAETTVVTSTADDAQLIRDLCATVDQQECVDALRSAWGTEDVRILVRSNKEPEDAIDEKLVAAYRTSKWAALTAPVDEAKTAWAYTDFGPAGKIVEQKELKDLEIVQARLANNVRVNVKRTAFDKNSVQVQVNFGGGLLEAPADKPGLVQFTQGTFMAGSIEGYTFEALQRTLADKNVGASFIVGEDAFQLVGQCTPAALETQLQVYAALLKAPAFRAEAAEQFQKGADGQYTQLERTPDGIFARKVVGFLHGDDPRFGAVDRESLRARTMDEVKAWLAGPLKEGYLEVAIVGDIDPQQALELVAKTLGTLGERAAKKPVLAEQRKVRFPTSPKAKEFRFAADTSRAMVLVAWPTTDGRDLAQSFRLGLLASVLEDRVRVKVREELGASYSPSVISDASQTLTDYGLILAPLEVEANQTAEIGTVVATIAAELRDGAISDDEFERAVKPQTGNIAQSLRSNGYWRQVMSDCQERPQVLDDARNMAAIHGSITKTQIEALAKKYLAKDQATIVTLTPEKAVDTKVSSAPANAAASR